jgi:hypothetical protein
MKNLVLRDASLPEAPQDEVLHTTSCLTLRSLAEQGVSKGEARLHADAMPGE